MSDRPALRMIVGHGGVLSPADAYSEQNMMRYQVGREIEIKPKVDLSYWKRRRYFQILDLVIERCETRWKSADELHEVLKFACGVIKLSVSMQGREVVYPGTTTTMEDIEFDNFYENAMAWLFEATDVDPETLEKEVGPPVNDIPESTVGLQQASVEEGDGRSPPPEDPAVADHIVMVHSNIVGSIEADERAMVNDVDPMSTRELKQEAIQKVLDLYLDGTITDDERKVNLVFAQKWWRDKLPGHPNFIKSVFTTAAKVMHGDITRPDAAKYLYGLRDG